MSLEVCDGARGIHSKDLRRGSCKMIVMGIKRVNIIFFHFYNLKLFYKQKTEFVVA